MSIKLHHADHGADCLERAHDILRQEFISAICEDPRRIVSAPAWNGPKPWSAAMELEEMFGDVGMGAKWIAIAAVLGRVANGQMDQMTHMLGKALLAELADKYARWHGDDLAEQLKEEDEK